MPRLLLNDAKLPANYSQNRQHRMFPATLPLKCIRTGLRTFLSSTPMQKSAVVWRSNNIFESIRQLIHGFYDRAHFL